MHGWLTLALERTGRRKPLAPTCNICLIRNDLTTIWCEVTSSVRNRDAEIESSQDEDDSKLKKPPPGSEPEIEEPQSESCNSRENCKEILLCLRPISDGEKHVTKEIHLVTTNKTNGQPKTISEANSGGNSSGVANNSGDIASGEGESGGHALRHEPPEGPPKMRPPKKRRLAIDDKLPSSAEEGEQINPRTSSGSKDVLESLMLMPAKSD